MAETSLSETTLVEDMHQFYHELWNWCFPELLIWEVFQIDDFCYFNFTTAYKNFSWSLSESLWEKMEEKRKHFWKIKLTHRILNDNTTRKS